MKKTLPAVGLSLALMFGAGTFAVAQSSSASRPASHLFGAGEGSLADQVHIAPSTMRANTQPTRL